MAQAFAMLEKFPRDELRHLALETLEHMIEVVHADPMQTIRCAACTIFGKLNHAQPFALRL